MIEYEIAFLIAVLAFTYTNILTEPNQIFNGLYKKLDSLFNGTTGKKHWLFKIIIHCEKCFAGQTALWLYALTHIMEYQEYPWETPFLHIAFIAFTIFLTSLITHIYKIIEKWAQ